MTKLFGNRKISKKSLLQKTCSEHLNYTDTTHLTIIQLKNLLFRYQVSIPEKWKYLILLIQIQNALSSEEQKILLKTTSKSLMILTSKTIVSKFIQGFKTCLMLIKKILTEEP